MEIALLILGSILFALIALIAFGRIKIIIENRQAQKIIEAHRRIGFPELDKKIQFSILETYDLRPIVNLIPQLNYKFHTHKLLKYYITITKEELIEHLIISGFIEKHTIIDDPDTWLQDGIWLKDYGQKKIIVDQEKGHVFNTWTVNTNREVAKIYSEILWKKINY